MINRALFLLLGTVILTIMGISTAYGQENEPEEDWNAGQIIRAEVLDVHTEMETGAATGISGKEKNQLVTVKLIGGQYNGQLLQLPHVVMDQPGYDIEVRPGEEVIVYVEYDGNNIKNAYIEDYARDKKLFYLVGLFVLLLILIGGKKGIKSVISLAITGGAIFLVLLPLIFRGHDPIVVTILVSAAVAAVTLIMIGGISVKTIAAIIGTTGGVLTAGTLAFIVGTAARLTGFSDEEMHMLLYIPQQVNFDYRGILFAGMIIGALGAVMDVGMSIASAVEEIKKANPFLRAGALIRAGMNVGRDIMGTMANTLILAYTGGAIPLMLVFMAYNMPFIKAVNLDLIATEIVRALAGSIGLILAIPITSIIAGLLFGQMKVQPQEVYDYRNEKGPLNY
ncbi:Uncharacterized membrane protein [Desulfotomaculum arcticum]|uniref:Uncharacterized membrane protein n=1 Tax=Desulfotruncus arcticus DSM 17038 TaxID=1121424 RepID=A0A1I2PHB3_9FIRM|nr:YibE/F family protein [Desulfotruncus arcticus]SFG14529.1 Uncharacterized membrane protein [Desulfotomaculum arcticum] [Desulfotruncus arcticus DSM 17038]